MAILLTDREKEIFERAKEYALSYIAPRAAAWEEGGVLPREAVESVAQNGFFGIGCPVELGGKGYSVLETALTYEGLAHGAGGFAFFVQLHNNITYDMAVLYPEVTEAVKKLIPEMTSGKKLTCYALTEENAGCDPSMSTAYAELREDGYHIFGEKTWASNCVDADYYTVIVKNGKDSIKDMLILLVEKGTPGFSVVCNRRRAGGNVMSCGTIRFDDVVVPKERLMSTNGFKQALIDIDMARIFVPAIAVGVAQHALDITVEYLAKRQTFGKPLLKNQALQFQLAELTAKVESARWLVYRVASLADTGAPISYYAAMTKLLCPNIALETTQQCAQMFGAVGFEYNSEISRCLNMARTMKIMDGSTEVQKIVIGRTLERAALPRTNR